MAGISQTDFEGHQCHDNEEFRRMEGSILDFCGKFDIASASSLNGRLSIGMIDSRDRYSFGVIF
jgi:hypothetical protein